MSEVLFFSCGLKNCLFVSVGTQAEETWWIQTYCRVSVQASYPSSTYLQLSKPYRIWCYCGGWCCEGGNTNCSSKSRGWFFLYRAKCCRRIFGLGAALCKARQIVNKAWPTKAGVGLADNRFTLHFTGRIFLRTKLQSIISPFILRKIVPGERVTLSPELPWGEPKFSYISLPNLTNHLHEKQKKGWPV